MNAYKGFNKDMICRGFQYEPGKEYEQDGKIQCCKKGFHACERPLDVLRYYTPATSRYFEVEQSGDMDRDGKDTKVASSKIKIGAEIDIPGLVKAQVKWVKAHTTTKHTDPKQATAGYKGAATAGEYGAATAGECGAATAGEYGAATAGYKGAATSRGSAAVGENGIACVRGNNVKIKGSIGALLVIGIEKNDYDLKEWKAVIVDGVSVKADTFYTLKDSELVEVIDR